MLALSYRLVIGVLSGYLVVRLAPNRPLMHAAILAGIALVLTCLGIVAALSHPLGPLWYPIALALSAVPTVMGGAILARSMRQS